MLDKWAGMKLFTGAAAEAYVRDMNRTLEAVRGILELCEPIAGRRWTISRAIPNGKRNIPRI